MCTIPLLNLDDYLKREGERGKEGPEQEIMQVEYVRRASILNRPLLLLHIKSSSIPQITNSLFSPITPGSRYPPNRLQRRSSTQAFLCPLNACPRSGLQLLFLLRGDGKKGIPRRTGQHAIHSTEKNPTLPRIFFPPPRRSCHVGLAD